MKEIKFVIWDWNGTLVNDAPISLDVLNRMLLRRGRQPITLERYQNIYEHPIIRIYERSGFDLKAERFEDLADEWHSDYHARLQNVELHEDSLETLEKFRDQGIMQSVLSALPHDVLCAGVERLQLTHFFTAVQGLQDRLARSKIDNAHLHMERIGAAPDETVVIGDSTHDVEVAEALGVKCFLVGRGYEHPDRLIRHGARVFSNFSEMRDASSLS